MGTPTGSCRTSFWLANTRETKTQSRRERRSINSSRPAFDTSSILLNLDELVPYEAILSEEARNSSINATYQRFPIRDNSVPSDSEHLAEILLAIDRRIREGGAVYLHCWGGVGRTGLVVACWLQEHGRTPDDALAELSAKWSTVEKIYRKPESPETPAQVSWIKTWPQRRRSVQQLMLRDRYRGALLGLAVGDALRYHVGV